MSEFQDSVDLLGHDSTAPLLVSAPQPHPPAPTTRPPTAFEVHEGGLPLRPCKRAAQLLASLVVEDMVRGDGYVAAAQRIREDRRDWMKQEEVAQMTGRGGPRSRGARQRSGKRPVTLPCPVKVTRHAVERIAGEAMGEVIRHVQALPPVPDTRKHRLIKPHMVAQPRFVWKEER